MVLCFVMLFMGAPVTYGVDISFDVYPAVFNKDLWYQNVGKDSRHIDGCEGRFIAAINNGSIFDLGTVTHKFNGSIYNYAEKVPAVNHCLYSDKTLASTGIADYLTERALISSGQVPVVLYYDDVQRWDYGVHELTFYAADDSVLFSTIVTIAQNEVYENAEWTTGSSEGLLIAKMPNITNDLLATLISDLKISKDGTQLFEGKGNTDILEANSETGNVYIKKEILDTLEAGTYSIGFTAGNRPELFNFVVVAASDSEVRTLSTDVTISVGGVAKNQKIMVRDINNILSDDTQLQVDVAADAHDELDVPVFDVEHGFHYNVKLLDSAGKELEMPLSAQVELLFECVEGLDIGQLQVVLADSLTDTQFEEDYQTYGDVQYVGVLTNHFSPYSLFDIQTEDEKAAIGKGKNNVKTGDHAVQIAVVGLGSILVLALGIMLRLITNKRNFEE